MARSAFALVSPEKETTQAFTNECVSISLICGVDGESVKPRGKASSDPLSAMFSNSQSVEGTFGMRSELKYNPSDSYPIAIPLRARMTMLLHSASKPVHEIVNSLRIVGLYVSDSVATLTASGGIAVTLFSRYSPPTEGTISISGPRLSENALIRFFS